MEEKHRVFGEKAAGALRKVVEEHLRCKGKRVEVRGQELADIPL